MMHRNRHGGRDRYMGNMGNMGLGDGLLGEGPSMGGGGGGGGRGYPDQMVNQQLMLAQSLIQQQQALTQRLNMAEAMAAASDFGGRAGFMPRGMGMGGGGGMGRMGDMGGLDRKRMGPMRDRNVDAKRRRQDSIGRGGGREGRSRRDSYGSRGGSGEGRDRNRASRWDSGDKTNDDYDPAEPTDADDVGGRDANTSKDSDGNLYCHVCNVSVYDDESFKRHLNGTKHAARMNSLLTVHEMKSNQLKSRLKAEEHLRNIERKGGRDPDFFCKICNNDLTIPWKRHCFSNIHKQRLLQVRRGCGWCDVHNFTNFTEVLEHRETELHRKNAEIYGKKEKDEKEGRRRSRSRERKSERGDSDRKDKKAKAKVEEEEDLTIPDYDAEKPVGVNYIIPVTGFFCKLCHKFYNNEKSAKGAHCQTESHYEKFKLAMEVKVAAREKRKAEEAEEEAKRKAEEEEEKMKKEEEQEESKEVEGDEPVQEDEEEEMEEDAVAAGDGEEEEEQEENGADHEEDSEAKPEDMDELAEDFDEDLPLDEEGDGTMGEGEEDLTIRPDAHGAFLDDTNADASFEFLSGDMAQAHLELQKAEEMLLQKHQETSQGPDDQAGEDSESTSLSASQEETPAVEEVEDKPKEEAVTPTPTPPSKGTARRGTARRGRGRGRAKK